MSIASEITRLQGVKSDILTAIGNKGVTVPAGSALDDCPGLIADIPTGPNYKVIGGREYRTVVMPDGKEWLAENLDFKFNGCYLGQSGVPTTPNAWYYDNDEATYGIDGTKKCGLLYNWYAAKFLNDHRSDLCPGWHVPSSAELEALLNATGGSGTTTPNTKLKAANNSVTSNWPSNWNGTDDYGFKALPGGERDNNGSFSDIDGHAQYCGNDAYSIDDCYYIRFGRYAAIVSVGHNQKNKGYSLRLVRDT